MKAIKERYKKKATLIQKRTIESIKLMLKKKNKVVFEGKESDREMKQRNKHQ